MLIDFTVENFRSIKGPVTLSAAAHGRIGPDGTKRILLTDNSIASTFSVKGRKLELLPTLGIFGPNASGKSNVIGALDELLGFLAWGTMTKQGSNILLAFNPFRLSKETPELPTKFELRVVRQGIIFAYAISLTRNQIVRERLDYVPRKSKRVSQRLLFERVWEPSDERYRIKNGEDFGNTYKKIQSSLRTHEPFLGFLSHRLKAKVVEPFTDWLTSYWPGVMLGWEDSDHDLATKLDGIYPERREIVTQLIRHFDTGITGFDIEVEEDPLNKDGTRNVFVYHDSDSGPTRWAFEEESMGTQRLFSLLHRLLDAFHNGGIMIIDELGSNFHPAITRTVIQLFQNKKTNPNRAQLIFTSHDNTLQKGKLLRRDQIWFTEKQPGGSTKLYPMSDFRPRNDLAVDKAYLDGRFGAIPILPSEQQLINLLGYRE